MNDKVKIIVAVVCIGLAGVVLAYQMGMFSSSKPKGAKTTENGSTALDELDREPAANGSGASVIQPVQPGGRSGIVLDGQ